MTTKEYRDRRKAIITRRTKTVARELSAVRLMYTKALRRAARVVTRLPRTALSDANAEAIIAAIGREQLHSGIADNIRGARKALAIDAFSLVADYVADAAEEAGVLLDVRSLFDRAATKIAGNAVIRSPLVFNAPQKTLSDTVWEAVDDFSAKILAVIEGELKIGTDPVEISRVLEQYLAGGPEVVKGRWLRLKPDTTEYRQRLGKGGADYRTQRVVRTQLYDAIRESDIQSGTMNPGSTGMFTWDLTFRSTACDTCIERSNGGPYTAREIRSLKEDAHPNCSCQCNEVLKDHDSFIAELKAYGRGEEGPISDWATLYGID